MENYAAHKVFKKELEVDFEDKELEKHDKVMEIFKLSKEKQAVDDMQEKMFGKLKERMGQRQLIFYAFLNKQFNIMNYKSARCSMHCFDNDTKPLGEVNECL